MGWIGLNVSRRDYNIDKERSSIPSRDLATSSFEGILIMLASDRNVDRDAKNLQILI